MIPFESDSRVFCAVMGIPWTEEYARGYAANMLLMRRAMGREGRRDARRRALDMEIEDAMTDLEILAEEEAPEIDEDAL